MTDLALAAEFPPPTREAWRAAAEKALKGRDFDRTLVGRTRDGSRLEPLYAKAEPASPEPAGRGHAPWRVVARVDHPDPAEAHALALADLAGGADSLAIVLRDAPSARGFGLPPDGLERALDGVMLDLIALRLEPGPHGPEAARALSDLARRRGHDPATLDVDLGLDPIGFRARSGDLEGWEKDLAAARSKFSGPCRIVRADGRPYHEAGATEAQELAAVLATGLAYLRALEASGAALESARDALSFLLVADADEFLTVAKLRAFRRLWAAVERACGLDPAPARVAAETAWRMTTRRDPWVNLLRGTLACFSAGIGGADAISCLPFTAALGLPDAFARRLARNTQLVFLEEANLWRVADPVAGSGAFEALTDGLAEAAWSLLQEIEREGGIAGALSSGALPGRIAAARTARQRAVALRRDPITGTSEYPDLRETPVSVSMPFPAQGERSGALPSTRDAETYEDLRDRSDERLAREGRRPTVFLANLGTPAEFTARTTFARNAFEAVGIEAITIDGFAAADAVVEAFCRSGTSMACLCSSDENYAEHAEATARALRGAGADCILLAGKPGDRGPALREAGVSRFLSAGSDLPELLGDLV